MAWAFMSSDLAPGVNLSQGVYLSNFPPKPRPPHRHHHHARLTSPLPKPPMAFIHSSARFQFICCSYFYSRVMTHKAHTISTSMDADKTWQDAGL